MRRIMFLLTIFFSFIVSAEDITDNQQIIAYRLPIFSNINSTVWIHSQRAFKEARELQADMIIVHMNTYGGEVVFADSLRTKILNSDIPVYIFIDNNAASAGALISIACKKIYMRPGANMGAATVVNQSGDEMPDKYQSYMRSTIRATAEAHGKDTIIVGNDTIIKWVRDPKIAEAMVDERMEIPGLSEVGQVLTFTAQEALEHGFCDGIANNINEVLAFLDAEGAEVISFKPTLYDGIKGFLTSPVLRALLILIILGGLYFELQTPGVGFPLIASISAAVLYFAPLYIDGLAANWEIAIFVIGVLLIALEIFAFPGFGITGISGIILAVSGLILSLLDNDLLDFKMVETASFTEAVLIVFGGLFGGMLSMIYLSSKLTAKPNSPLAKITLQTTQDTDKGYVSVDSEMKNLVGKTGRSATVLRPAGKVIVDDELYDARAMEGFIDAQEKVEIISFSSGQLNVRKK